jgi:hypothetical protein
VPATGILTHHKLVRGVLQEPAARIGRDRKAQSAGPSTDGLKLLMDRLMLKVRSIAARLVI